eukprot:GHUV01003295.1.p1 GENE.GHUV01003295.1~~GHUV01003295.1.p1  ORF type:complete len:112 (-),score=18.81 GHUV01003295.1:1200-1535(-)
MCTTTLQALPRLLPGSRSQGATSNDSSKAKQHTCPIPSINCLEAMASQEPSPVAVPRRNDSCAQWYCCNCPCCLHHMQIQITVSLLLLLLSAATAPVFFQLLFLLHHYHKH